MAERRDGKHQEDPDHLVLIEIEPTELVIKGDGSKFVAADMKVTATNQDVADAAAEAFIRMTGGEFVGGNSGNSSVAFSRNKWKAPWNPTGPKPNWRVDPPRGDPSLN